MSYENTTGDKIVDISKLSMKQIKEKLELETEERLELYIQALESDLRTSCHSLAKSLKRKTHLEQNERDRLKRIVVYEQKAWEDGYCFVAGLDEAGRGPLIGPVVAAAVILKPDMDITGIDDSKKLSAAQRECLYEVIAKEAVSYGIGVADHHEIDEINILNATKLAMKRALDAMEIKPDYLLIDALRLPHVELPQKDIIKGDSKSVSIAAASILAKVSRDRMMIELSKKYPEYGFESNKGYGTDVHYNAIRAYGILPEHRRSFLKGFENENLTK
ncbi:ribonuclease HII [Fusibacter bizertensis]